MRRLAATALAFALTAARVWAAETPAAPIDTAPRSAAQQLIAAGFTEGAAALLRVFKDSRTLEIWLQRRGRFQRFAALPICRMSGGLGPKLAEGDRQAPEGIYAIRAGDLMANARWHRAMRLNFPNAVDIASARGGSGILIHGKCSSSGCFAMGDDQAEFVHDIVAAALDGGQLRVPVEVYPFPLTAAALAARASDENAAFWRSLKPAHDALFATGLPAPARLCGTGYGFAGRGAKGRAAVAACVPLPSATGTTAVAAAPRQRAAPPAARAATDCDPRAPQCRRMKAAAASPAICPRKYARCRIARIAAIKSIDCPLKFPRCRGRAAGTYAQKSVRGRAR